MKRGNIVVGAMRGEFTGKPRPYIVVQRETTLADSVTITACPVTTGLIGGSRVRVAIVANATTGLETASEVEIDRITTLRKVNIRQVVGSVSSDTMNAIDAALRQWLDL